MKKLRMVGRYIIHLFTATTKYKVHSPFVYDLVTKVLHDHTKYDDYQKLKEVTKKQAQRVDVIETVDFGASAGDYGYKTSMVPKGRIVKQRTTGKKQLKLLYKLSKYFQPKTMLELGTAAGISTSYLMKGTPSAKMITLEGCASLADFAESTFQKMHIKHVEIISGNFDITLKEALEHKPKFDLVFFDGNHRKDPTIRYFKQCLEKIDENSLFIFDDIHWSNGMEEAWETIKADENVTLTIDLFHFGLVFFKKDMVKQHFIIKY